MGDGAGLERADRLGPAGLAALAELLAAVLAADAHRGMPGFGRLTPCVPGPAVARS